MRAEEFFHEVPALFRQANAKSWEAYEETLYTMHRPLTYGNFHRIKRFVGAESAPTLALRDGRVYEELHRVLGKARYPKAGHVTRLDDFADGSSELATALLHFNNPAYPIYDTVTVRGLLHLGFVVSYVATIGEETTTGYQGYVNAIQELKDDIPYYCVPEKNHYLTRIIQSSAHELGLRVPPAVRAKPAKAPSRRPEPAARR